MNSLMASADDDAAMFGAASGSCDVAMEGDDNDTLTNQDVHTAESDGSTDIPATQSSALGQDWQGSNSRIM